MSDLFSSPAGPSTWSLGAGRQTASFAGGGDVAQLGRATGSSANTAIADTETWMIWQWSGLRHL